MPFKLARFVSITAAAFEDRADLVAENVASPTFVADTSRVTAQASSRRSCLLGPFVSFLEWLEGKSGSGEASHRCGLASQGFQNLLAVEEQKTRRWAPWILRRNS